MKKNNNGLDLKYRPDNFEKVLGNDNEIKNLINNLDKEDGKRCFVFTGPAGCGKTTLARIAADYVGADEFSNTEINTGNNRGIDSIREILDNCRYTMGNSKVFIIDEAHGLTTDAKRALLKPTEEPEDNVYFFFITTDPIKLFKGDEGKALKTRLIPVKVESIKPPVLYKHLRRICKKEGLDLDNDVLEFISKNANGSPRNALISLDVIKDIEETDDQIEKLENMTFNQDPEVYKFCQELFSKKPSFSSLASKLLIFKESTDAETIRRIVMGYAQSIILKSKFNNPNACWILECFCECDYSRGFPGITLATAQALQEPE